MSKERAFLTLAALLLACVCTVRAGGTCYKDGTIECGAIPYTCALYCKHVLNCDDYDAPMETFSKPWAQPGSPGKDGTPINTQYPYVCTKDYWCESSGVPCGSGGWLRVCEYDIWNWSFDHYEYGSQPNGSAC